jgi:hypothetical protein
MVVSGTQQPARLTASEKAWSALLVVAGLILVVGVLAWFADSTDGTLKTKETSSSEPVGEGATGHKVSSSTDYSENLVLGALGTGAALILAGAFYGRIREIKLPGGVTVGLGELPEKKKKVIEEAVENKIELAAVEPGQKQIIATAAKGLALERFGTDYWGVVPQPPDEYLRSIGEQAAEDAVRALTRT